MKKLKLIAATCIPAALLLLAGCKGRTTENVEANGDTVNVDLPEPQGRVVNDSVQIDVSFAPNESVSDNGARPR